MSISDLFLVLLGDKNGLWISVLLVLGVIFVNGWTDAPNAITASVSTDALKLKSGIIVAAIFNFVGAVVMGFANTSVLHSVEEITMMINGDKALPILSASLLSIIIWSIAAWYFGIPTSESHALISGIFGAAVACNGGVGGLELSVLKMAIIGLFLSLPIGAVLGLTIGKILDVVSFNSKKGNNEKIVKRLQRVSSASMAFMHGAQDSQKFAGVFLAALMMSGSVGEVSNVPIWLILLCSAVISLGTAVGGYRIIKRVGMETVELTPLKGLASDVSASICMLGASMLGIPVSTTHTATASVIGAGMASSPRRINMRSVKEMMLAWMLTFPCCGLIAYFLVTIYLLCS